MYDILINDNELALRNSDTGYVEMIGIVNNVCININDNSNKKDKFVGFNTEYLTICSNLLNAFLDLRDDGFSKRDALIVALERVDFRKLNSEMLVKDVI